VIIDGYWNCCCESDGESITVKERKQRIIAKSPKNRLKTQMAPKFTLKTCDESKSEANP
jgi:hypothetical protein